jgi:hypothetical protein
MGGAQNFVFSGSSAAEKLIEDYEFDLPMWIDRLTTAFKYVSLLIRCLVLNSMCRVAEAGNHLFGELGDGGSKSNSVRRVAEAGNHLFRELGDGGSRSSSEQPEASASGLPASGVKGDRDENRTSSRQLLVDGLSE